MANPRIRALTWWRKWTKKDWAIAVAGCTSIIFLLSFFFDSRTVANSGVHPSSNPAATNVVNLVDLTLLHNAEDRGAFCLDGSLPAYHFRRGFGSGSNSWILHIEGGGWCSTLASCAQRKMTALGSSNYMEQVSFRGILSSHPSENPEVLGSLDISWHHGRWDYKPRLVRNWRHWEGRMSRIMPEL